MGEREGVGTSLGDGEFEVTTDVGDDTYAIVLEANTDILDGLAAGVDNMATDDGLCRQMERCQKGSHSQQKIRMFHFVL